MITLTAIVKDESQVAERWFRSVEGKIADWVIIDTGSTDNTQEIVEREAARQNLPGRFEHYEWVDFETNRNVSLRTAEEGDSDWMLILDADEELVGDLPELDPKYDAYEIEVTQDVHSWWSVRFLKTGRGWKYVGAAHAVPERDANTNSGKIHGATIHHHNDGGCKDGRRERNRVLLEKAVETNPDDPRSWFYLAQECRWLGDKEAALEAYRRRIELVGWHEEKWNAMFHRGVLLEDYDESVAQLEEAYRFRPSRLEALYALILQHRLHGHLEKAAAVGAVAMSFNSGPPPDRLFVNRWVYEEGLKKEFGIACILLRETMLKEGSLSL